MSRGDRLSDIRILTWNIQRYDDAWPRRAPLVAAALQRADADVIALQEVTSPQLALLRRALPAHACIPGEPNERDEREPIFARADRLRVLESGTVWLSDAPHKARSRSWGNRIARSATWARLARADGAAMTLVNAHFDHESEPMRVKSARLLAERFPGAVILGDINADPASEAHDVLTADRVDAFPARGAETMAGDEGPADERFDAILVPPTVRAVAPFLMPTPEDDGIRASDHHALGVDADIVERQDREK